MRATTPLILLALAACLPHAARAVDCAGPSLQQPLRPTVIAPVAPELAVVYNPLGAPGGVLSEAYDESASVDQVLLRIRAESCRGVATAEPAPGVVDPGDPAAYKPRTKYDNAPWRFNMTQNGKSMTADEFTAWMKARGVRVAKGRAPAEPAEASAPTVEAVNEAVEAETGQSAPSTEDAAAAPAPR